MKKNVKATKNKKNVLKWIFGVLIISAIATPNVLLYNLNKEKQKSETKKTDLDKKLNLINFELTNAKTEINNLEKENQISNENLEKLRETFEKAKEIAKAIDDNGQLITGLINDSLKQINNLRPNVPIEGHITSLWFNILNNNILKIKEILEKSKR